MVGHMQTRIASISKSGQVTIPDDMLGELGSGSPDTVLLVLRDDGVLETRPSARALDDVFGSVPPLPGESPDLVREINEAVEAACLERHQGRQDG